MIDWKSPLEYPVTITEKVRLSDTDRQGHVNNVAFSYYYEAGRGEILFSNEDLLEPGCFFVIVTTTIDFVGEIHFPGSVQVANAIERLGNTSVTFRQALFQDGRCASLSHSTMAQVNISKKSAQPLSEYARSRFGQLMAGQRSQRKSSSIS